MGYESNGSGTFTLRDASKKEEAIKAVAEDFEIKEYPGEKFEIRFDGLRLYSAGKYMKKIAEYFNGEFDIEGDEKDDIFKLEFRDGKAFRKIATITYTYSDPVETDLNSQEWN